MVLLVAVEAPAVTVEEMDGNDIDDGIIDNFLAVAPILVKESDGTATTATMITSLQF